MLLIILSKKEKKAIDCYDKALKLDPNNVMALSNKGAALANSGDLFNAVKTFDKALEIDPYDNNTKTNREMLVKK